MAAIIQRLSTGNSTNGNGDMLTEEELNQLQGIVEEISVQELKQPDGNTKD
jgi:pantothenate kinase